MENETKHKIGLVVIAFLILIVPFLSRLIVHGGYPLGYNSYESIAGAKNIINDLSIIKVDDSSYLSRPYIINGYDLILASFSQIFSIWIIALILPLIAGVITSFLVYRIADKIGVKNKGLMSMIFLISPSFFYLFSTNNPSQIGLLLNLGGLYFLLGKKWQSHTFGTVMFCLTPFFGLYHYLVSLSILLVFLIFSKKKFVYASLIISGIISLTYFSYIILHIGFPEFFYSYSAPISSYMIADLGGIGGFGIFTIFLSLLGIIISWRYKKQKKFYIGYLSLIFFVLLTLAEKDLIIYLSLPVSFFAAYSFKRIFTRQWQLHYIKDFTLLLMICGLLFSFVSYSTALMHKGPSLEEISSLSSIKSGSVFSHPENGFLISVFTEKKVVIDNKMPYYYDKNALLNDTNEVFYSRNLEKTKNILNKYKVSYIWINSNMKDKLWSKPDEGIQFLFRNNETFKNIERDTNIEIWEIIKK